MKVLLILPSDPFSAPYLQYYIKVLEENNIVYDVCCWSRNKEVKLCGNYRVFDKRCVGRGLLKKIYLFYLYRKFVKAQFYSENYDVVIVFTIQMAIFLSDVLLHCGKKYILDVRDYSIILKIPFVSCLFKDIIKKSSSCFISSWGFTKWMPNYKGYYISHNIDKRLLSKNDDIFIGKFENHLVILTIGALRDLDSNIRLITGLANDCHFTLNFVGKGSATQPTQKFIDDNSIKNAEVRGWYDKIEEEAIVLQADMINLLLSDGLNNKTLMANRFYLSVLYRKPLIVSAGTESAYYAEKYYLGVVINDDDCLKDKILDFWENFDSSRYNYGCNEFIALVKADIDKFESKLINNLFYVNIQR